MLALYITTHCMNMMVYIAVDKNNDHNRRTVRTMPTGIMYQTDGRWEYSHSIVTIVCKFKKFPPGNLFFVSTVHVEKF